MTTTTQPTHVSPRNRATHKGEWETCVWCGPPGIEIERESNAKLQQDLARIMFEEGQRRGQTAASGADYIISPDHWHKAEKRLERRDKSEPDALLTALLDDLGIPFRRVM